MLCAPLPLLISVAEVASSICARFNRVPFYFFGALFLWVFCTRCSRFFFLFLDQQMERVHKFWREQFERVPFLATVDSLEKFQWL